MKIRSALVTAGLFVPVTLTGSLPASATVPAILKTARAQSGGQAPTVPLNISGPPEPVLYRLFIKTAMAMERAGDASEAKGENAAPFRDYFIRNGMTAAECGVIMQITADESAQEQPLMQQEKTLIQGFRQAMRNYKLGLGPQPSPPLAQLRQIQSERDALAMEARTRLHLLLGDDGFDRLEVYIHGSFGHAAQMKVPVPISAAAPGGGH